MADDDEVTPEELAARKRASAQDAAADLVRMGIDPRSLGLEAPAMPDPDDAGGPGGRRAAEPDADLAPPSLGPTPSRAAASSDPAEPSAERVPTTGSSAGDEGGRVVALRPGRHAPPGSAADPTVDPRAVPLPGRPLAPEPAGPAARPAVTAGPLEQLLSSTLRARPVPAASGRVLRSMARGLVTPDAAGAAGAERELVAAARGRQVAPRVVALVAGKGGVGTTTAALGAGAALAALRDDETVVADLRPGTPSLGLALTGAPAPTVRVLARDDAGQPLELPGGLRVVDGTGWGGALRRTDVAPLLDHLTAGHTFCLLDLGNDAGDVTEVAVARADQVVVVTEPGPAGLGAARAVAERLTDIDPFALDLAIHVVVCTRDQPYREVLRQARDQLAVAPARLIVIPPDPYLAAGEVFAAAALRPATREAMLQLAAALALGGRGPARQGAP